MIGSPLKLEPVFSIGPVPITEPVLVTWGIMLLIGGFAALATRRLTLEPSRTQAVLEMVTGAIDDQIRGTMQVDPTPYRTLIGTIFLYLLVANWSSLVPGIEPPTAHLETDAALAFIVFGATIFYGIGTRGLAATSRPSPNRAG